MRPIGFSTGAIAKGDFVKGLETARSVSLDCVELSALRTHELRPLLDALPGLALSEFGYVSIHAPKLIIGFDEELDTASDLYSAANRIYGNIILHADAIVEFSIWRMFRTFLCIENMHSGRFGSRNGDLELIFSKLPEAHFCLDLGHARQVDPTMNEAHWMLDEFGDRLRQVHISDVDKNGKHRSLSKSAIEDFRPFAERIPEHTPIIIESTGLEDTTNELYHDEVSRVRYALSL